MKQFKFCVLAVLFLFSCSQDTLVKNEENSSSVDNASQKEALLIDKTSINLDSNDAKNVAMLFRSRGGETRSSADVSLEKTEIQTVTDSISNVPLLYIINWGNDNGYVMVSANKKNTPILAYSNTGSFNSEAELASKNYVEGYKAQIKEAYQDISDSLRLKYALEWAVFEQVEPDTSIKTRASNAGIEQKMQDEINKKKALGYTYIGKVTAAAYYLPASDYQTLVKEVSTYTDANYDYEEVSLFFIKSFDYEKIGPLIGTKWHQNAPFNVGAPNGYAGCVPIAVAQIAYYHKYPDKYDWNQISSNPVLNNAFEYFMTDIRNLCNVEYKNNGTSASYDDAYDAFKSLGYTATKGGVPDFIKLRDQIQANNPVYIRGENSLGGHAWVCEGYENIKYDGVISILTSDPKLILATRTTSSPVYAEYGFNAYPTTSLDQQLYGAFYYMNMGWGGTNNGWYRANSNNPSRPNYSFLEDQKIITIKK